MSQPTSIAWTDHSWNPIRGCSRVSEGCVNCYAETIARRFSGPGQAFAGTIGGRGAWNGQIVHLPEKLWEPLTWRKPRKVFVNSMSDLFHENVEPQFIAAVFGVMAACPQHTFQILTKRPERAREWFQWVKDNDVRDEVLEGSTHGQLDCIYTALAYEVKHHPKGDGGPLHVKHCADPRGRWPLPNVWLGVSIEDRETVQERIPILLDIPAAIRWISAEPLLESVDIKHYLHEGMLWKMGTLAVVKSSSPGLDWVVVGGESGRHARECRLSWITQIIHDCKAEGVPVFVKQLGANPINDLGHMKPSPKKLRLLDRKGEKMAEWPVNLRVREEP